MLLKSSLMVTHVHVLTMVYFSLCLISVKLRFCFSCLAVFCLMENANWQNKVHGLVDASVSGGRRHKDVKAKINANSSLL